MPDSAQPTTPTPSQPPTPTAANPAAYTRNEVIDGAKLRGPPPRLTVLARGWFRLLFAPHVSPTPHWLRAADVHIHEARGAASWAVDPATPDWRRVEIEEYARMLVDAHNDVCAARTLEALASPHAPEVPVRVEAEVAGFRLVLLTPALVDSDDAGEEPAWLAPARATLHPPDAFELDVPEDTPTWLIEKYRAEVDAIYANVGFTLCEVDAVIRGFAGGSTLVSRLSVSFGIPEGYRRLVCSRVRTEGPARGDALLPRLSRLSTGLYRLDFGRSHEVQTLTFDLVNKTGTMSPDNPCEEALDYLEHYLLALRIVFDDDDGGDEYEALGNVADELRNSTLEEKEELADMPADMPVQKPAQEPAEEPAPAQAQPPPLPPRPQKPRIQVAILDAVGDGPAALVDSPGVMSPLASMATPPSVDEVGQQSTFSTEYTSHTKSTLELLDPLLQRMWSDDSEAAPEPARSETFPGPEPDPGPDSYPVDIDAVYAEFRARVLDIYRQSPPRQDQLAVLQERHNAFLRASFTVDHHLSSAEGDALLESLEGKIDGMLPPLVRRWYSQLQLNLPLWGQDLVRLGARMAEIPVDLQREEFAGADFECSDAEECTVCLEVIGPREAVAITPCYHLMHRDCLEDWFDSGSAGTCTETCPVCRRDMVLYESLLAVTRWPFFEIAWKAWMGQLEDDREGGEGARNNGVVSDCEVSTGDDGDGDKVHQGEGLVQ